MCKVMINTQLQMSQGRQDLSAKRTNHVTPVITFMTGERILHFTLNLQL